MKIFGTGATPFSPQGADIPEGDPQELKFVTDQFQNSVYGELFNFLASQGITPTATAGADLKQLKKAVLSTILSGNIYVDSGTANNKILTHQAGSAFSYKLINTLQNGFSLKFVNKVENTGAVQITVYDEENAANLSSLTNIPIFREDGLSHAAGDIKPGDLIYCVYSATPSPRFLSFVKKSNNFLINRKIITTSGTYQRTPGTFLAKVLIVGGGGGSGAVRGIATDAVHAPSGTCGWGMEFWLSRVDLEATDTTPISVTIGGGGTGAATIATNGSNGGSTIFGSIATVNGGLGSTSQTTHPSTNQVLNSGFISNDLTVYNGLASRLIRKIQPGLPQPGFQNGSIYAASNTGVSPLGFDLIGTNGNSGAHAALPADCYGSGGRGRVIYANNQVGVTFPGQNGNNGVVIIDEFFL